MFFTEFPISIEKRLTFKSRRIYNVQSCERSSFMDVLIVEDDQEQLDGIESILLEKYDHMNCIKATNYQQATQLMRANKIQLFLLDISLGDDESEQDGIALGTQIRSMQRYAKTPILYLTAYSMDAPRAIHATNCYDFLVKPYKKEDLLYTIDKLIHNRFLDVTPIELRDVNGIYFRVLPEKILYIKAAGKNLTIYEESNVINTSGIRLKELIAQLPPNFIQSHRSFIVNSDYVNSYDPTNALLYLGNHNISTPVGRKYKDYVKKIISRD